MINSIETYRESGRKAGKASRGQDAMGAKAEYEWAARATRLEQTPEDKAAARTAWHEGYKAGYGAVTPESFR